MTRLARWIAGWQPRTISIVGWLVFLLYAYPGYMSSDSIDQLLDSRVGSFNDWHSPVMTEIWRWVGKLFAGPASMLFLQGLLFLLGARALLARLVQPRLAALLACCLLVFPPVITTMAVIWQDSQMAGFLLAGLAAVTSRRRGAQIAGLALLVIACAMRPSAAFAVLPIVAISWHWPAAASWSRWRRAGLALGAWAAIWLAALGLDAGLRNAETQHDRLELATSDLLGMLRIAGPIDDAEVRRLLDGVALRGSDLQKRAAAFDAHPGKVSEGPDRLFDLPADADAREALIAAHRRVALAYPGAYLRQRWHLAYRLIGPRRTQVQSPVYVGFSGASWQSDAAVHTARHSAVQRGLIAMVSAVANSPIGWPILYFLGGIIALVVAIRRRERLATSLAASGVAYELSLLVRAHSPLYALSHWMITATGLAAVVLIVASRGRRAVPAEVAAAPTAEAAGSL